MTPVGIRYIFSRPVSSAPSLAFTTIRSYPEPPKLRHMGKPLPDERPEPKPNSPELARMLKMKGRK